MKSIAVLLIFMAIPALAHDAKKLHCGAKPAPPAGSQIGSCVNGQWQIVHKGGAAVINCGLKPTPNFGCHVGGCVNGQWQQVCESNPMHECGMKPLPQAGCHIGDCVDGQWQEVCDP